MAPLVGGREAGAASPAQAGGADRRGDGGRAEVADGAVKGPERPRRDGGVEVARVGRGCPLEDH
jgi:hypothetical protein